MALPAGRRQHGRPPGGILGALLAGPDSDIWLCRRDGANMVGRRAEFVAPCWRGPTVIYGFAGGMAPTGAAGGTHRRGTSVKILLPETKPQGFAGGGEQIAPLKRPPEADGGAEFV